jgi:hypothetical protein
VEGVQDTAVPQKEKAQMNEVASPRDFVMPERSTGDREENDDEEEVVEVVVVVVEE